MDAADPAVLTAAAMRVPGVGAGRLRALRDAYGTLAAALEGAAAGAAPPPGVPDAIFRRLRSLPDVRAAARELAEARGAGVEVLCWDDARYPAPLWLDRAAPPPLLYLQGTLPAIFRIPARQVRAAAVVGTRRATARGLALARELARELAELQVVVVSGLAIGIDGAAHEGALDAAGATVAVLGGGHGHLHPPSHRPLARRILAAGGAVISEQPPGVEPEPRMFPVRNRIISGLSRLVVVVEAGRSSGTNATAAYALDQHRDVFACPGRPGDPSVDGTLRLIRDGALPVTELEDVLCRFRAEPGDPGLVRGAAAGRDGSASAAERSAGRAGAAGTTGRVPPPAPHALGAADAALLDAALLDALFGLEETTLDELAAAMTAGHGAGENPEGRSAPPRTARAPTWADVAGLTARLTRLELRGAVVRTPAGRYRLPARERERRAAAEEIERRRRAERDAS